MCIYFAENDTSATSETDFVKTTRKMETTIESIYYIDSSSMIRQTGDYCLDFSLDLLCKSLSTNLSVLAVCGHFQIGRVGIAIGWVVADTVHVSQFIDD